MAREGTSFTTSCEILPQTILGLRLQLPSQRESIELEGEVLECKEIKKNLIYGIRVKFVNLEKEKEEALKKFVQLFLK